MAKGRQAESARRRDRVTKALADNLTAGEEISVSSIAARAGVDRTFLYRHRDLLEQIHATEAQPRSTTGAGPMVSRASLQADLLAAQQRCARMASRTQQLEARLSDLLGEHARRASGLGAPSDVEELQRKIVLLEQQVVDLRLQLDERDQEAVPPHFTGQHGRVLASLLNGRCPYGCMSVEHPRFVKGVRVLASVRDVGTADATY